MKATPPVPRKVDPDLRRFLEALKEKSDVGEGQRGDPANRYLKVSDLLDLGIVKRLTERGPVGPGTWAPTIPLPNMAIPPKPTNFEVTDGFSYVFLTWDRPNYSNHGFTEIWRSTDDNLANATLIQQQIGQMFADPDVNYGQIYYYWIRFHSQSISGGGRTGPYNSTVGSPGQIAQDPGQLLQQLTDKITASQLHADLKAPIAQIPSIITDLTQEIEDRVAAVNALLDDLGVIDGRVLAAESDITNLQSVAGDLSDGIQANTAATNALETRVTTNEGAITAQSSDIATLESGLTSANTSITANANATSALATRVTAAEGTITVQSADITALESGLTNANNNITANAGALTALTTRVTSAEGSITVNSDSITSLTAILDNPTTGTSSLASAFNGVNTSITQVDDRVTAEAGRIDALNATINDPATGLSASFDAINVLEGRVSSTETGLVAEANARDELRVEILGDEVTDGALATSINDLQATVSSTYATITDVNQLSVNLDGRVGTIEQRASATGDLGEVSAMWSVKGTVGEITAGFGFGVSDEEGDSQFYIQADTFSVYAPGTTGVKPFIIDNGNVVIDTAVIKEASITSAMIGTVGVDSIVGDKASFVSANITDGSITSAKIGTGEIKTANIDNAAITNAKIGNAQIDTLKLQGHSVVVTQAFKGVSQIALSDTWTEIAYRDIDFYNPSFNSYIILNMAANILVTPLDGWHYMRLYFQLRRETTSITSWPAVHTIQGNDIDVVSGGARRTVTLTWADSPGEGSHLYRLYARKGLFNASHNTADPSLGTAKCEDRIMILSGAKR